MEEETGFNGTSHFHHFSGFHGSFGLGDWLLTEKGGKANVKDNRSQVNIFEERDKSVVHLESEAML